MKKKIKVSLMLTAILFFSVSVTSGYFLNAKTTDTVNSVELNDNCDLKPVNVFGTTVLTEVRQNANNRNVSLRGEFDRYNILTGNGYKFTSAAFTGVIKNIRSFDETWSDEYGNENGPFIRTLITVDVKKDYCSNLPNKEVTLLSTERFSFDSSVKENKEYLFLNAWLLDKNYYAIAEKESPETVKYDKSLTFADVVIGGEWNSIFAVEDDYVKLYYEYFSGINNNYKKQGESVLVPYTDAEAVYSIILNEAKKEKNDSERFIRAPFDVNDALTGANGKFTPAAFTGTIREINAVNNGNDCLPEDSGLNRTLLTVAVNEDYNANLQYNKDIKILTTDLFDEDSQIMVGKEYFFVNCWIIDDKYYNQYSEAELKDDNNLAVLKNADIIIGGEWNSIFPICGDSVSVYYEYLKNIQHSYSNVGEKILIPVNELKSVYARMLDSVKEW